MSRSLAEFIDDFVVPLLGGGPVVVTKPLRPRDRERFAEQSGGLGHPQLRFLRLRRAQALTPHPLLPDPDLVELSLWMALHNTLVFDHPDRARVWARSSTWRRAEGATRTLLTLPFPTDLGEGLARHVSVGAFLELRRTDTIVNTATGQVKLLGQSGARSRFRFSGTPTDRGREERVVWFGQPHAPETHRLIEDALRASPLTCLLEPLSAPPGWSPLFASMFLRERGFARAICHRWASNKDWIAVGGAVTSALIPSLPPAMQPKSGSRPEDAVRDADDDRGDSPVDRPRALPGAVAPTDPVALAAVVGALIHLHFLKVLELDARLGVAVGSRDPGILWFLALPLLLPWLGDRMGTPLGGLGASGPFEAQTARRWTEYVDHLEELVPRSVVENLLSTLVPAITRPD